MLDDAAFDEATSVVPKFVSPADAASPEPDLRSNRRRSSKVASGWGLNRVRKDLSVAPLI